jgi:T5SS/PEP-CTERM-associated repeat protein
LDIGAEAGGIGVVTIDGATTKVRLNGSLMSVGEKGNGTLVLKNAQHLVAGEVDVAFNSGSNGNVSIQGAKTELDAGALDISGKGSSGGKGVVTVSDGILLVRDDTTVGEGGSLTITAQTSGQSSEIHLGSWLVNDGAVTADWNVLIAGAVSGEGAIDVGGDGVVIFQESVGTAQKVQFTGPGIIEIDSASAFHATIYGFNRVGTSIDLRNVAFSKSMGVNLVGSTLIVTPTKGAAVDLKLGGSLPAAVIVKKDGKGGTFIYVTPRRKEGANSPLIASQLHAEPLQNAQALSNLLAPFSRDDLSGMTASRSHLESRDFNSAWGWLGAADGAFSSPEASLVPLHLGYDSLIG